MTINNQINEHPDEKRIELYVLGSGKVTEQERSQIAGHLAACVECADLHHRIDNFYQALKGDLENYNEQLPVLSRGNFVQKNADRHPVRYADRPMIHEFESRLPFRIARWIVKHPVKASIYSLSSFALLGLLTYKLFGPAVVKDFSPINFQMRGQVMVLLNREGQEVGEWQTSKVFSDEYRVDRLEGEKKVGFADADNDGVNEIFYAEGGVDAVPTNTVIRSVSVNPVRENWSRRVRRKLDFVAKDEGNIIAYDVRKVIAGDKDGDRVPELYLLLTSGSFPSQVLKLKASDGEELGSYVHTGSLTRMYAYDLDGDSNDEIICSGTNNAFGSGVIVILDPRRISGISVHTPEYALKNISPALEKAYIRLPRTIVGMSNPNSARNSVVELNLNAQNDVFRVTLLEDGTKPTGSDYYVTFGYDLIPLGVEFGDGYMSLADSLYSTGKIAFKPDQAYAEKYMHQIQYWDGHEWKNKPTWMSK